MRIWTSNDFTGFYPVGSALVVIANDETEAKQMAEAICIEAGLDSFDGTLLELIGPSARMLHDGNY